MPIVLGGTLLTAAVLVVALVLTRRSDETSVATDDATVATEPARPQPVAPEELGLEEADLVVVMATSATPDQLTAVREAITSSPDAIRFAELTREQTGRELFDAVCRATGGSDETAAGRLRAWAAGMLFGATAGFGPSFRIVTGDGDEGAVTRLRDALTTLPGVISVAAGPTTDTSASTAPEAAHAGGTSFGFNCFPVQGETSLPGPGS